MPLWCQGCEGHDVGRVEGGIAVTQPLIWIAVPLMLIGAVLLVAGVGAAGLWIALITAGVALVAIDGYRRRQAHHV